MKRNRIGNADIDLSAPYWTGGKRSGQLRVSEVLAYAEIDLLQEEVNFCYNDDIVEVKYSDMDIVFLKLQAIALFGNDEEQLWRAGNIIGLMIDDGLFNRQYSSLDERNTAVNELVLELQESVASYNETRTASGDWLDDWQLDVMDLNYYPTGSDLKATTADENAFASIGATYDYDYYSAKMKEFGPYWIYCVAENISSEDSTPIVLKKRYNSMKHINWFSGANLGMSDRSILLNARAGIIANAEGGTPEDVIDGLRYYAGDEEKIKADKEKLGIGMTPIEWVMLFTAIVGLISAITTYVCDLIVRIKEINALSAPNAPTEAEMKANEATVQDWANYSEQLDNPIENLIDNIKDSFSSPILWAGAAALLIYAIM
jgi:hypothetical protein